VPGKSAIRARDLWPSTAVAGTPTILGMSATRK
jgi:hypothetical protein